MAKNKDLSSKRRRFQPPITTFFPAATGLSTCPPYLSHTHYSTITSSPTPTVDAKIQASLLSVGMRVRKSVAEGYKTRIPKSEDNPTLCSNETPITRCATPFAELAPFCGLTKSNESATQPIPHPYYNQLITDDGDAFSLPPSSQDSIESLQKQTNGQKRSYDDDDDFDDSPTPLGNTWQSTLNRDPSTGIDPVSSRTILTPTLGYQRRPFIALKSQMTTHVEDFEEPLFLRSREEVDMDLS
ncbi:ribonucleotide reductase inhibitor-domain-containing protein [Aspergillus coremiiformis]|uniref:Ribonucleotide reductase inhibitor-domain-containing protein n=1 Tax=Aspergillus coremiiformis TaxID=138285 RepID=A0A5N6Z1I8_9EURO|nr:ribonucleotide reductase inhibitor-domain-containing protein [Aspergillus coremiiformis]